MTWEVEFWGSRFFTSFPDLKKGRDDVRRRKVGTLRGTGSQFRGRRRKPLFGAGEVVTLPGTTGRGKEKLLATEGGRVIPPGRGRGEDRS